MNDDNPILTKKEYLHPSRYVSGRIVEYDIKSANINVLYNLGVIDKQKYDQLNILPKNMREITVGNMIQQDNTLYHTIMNGILKFRRILIESNNIKEEEVVRIATDAIYVNRFDDLKYTKFDNIEFKKKSESNNMVKLLDLLIFSKYIDNKIDIDVKGLGNNVELHQQFILSVIANVIYIFERNSVEDAIKYLDNVYGLYVKRQLPVGYYRQLNSISNYFIPLYNASIFDISQENISMVDISYNITYLRELHNILFEYFH